jgi:hypothetical protein
MFLGGNAAGSRFFDLFSSGKKKKKTNNEKPKS